MKRVNPKVQKKSAFTLIELLVVIAIIALLMSILMPSLSKVRKQAKAVVCGSNVRQLGMGWILYSEDNDGFFPVGIFWSQGMAWWKDGHGIENYLPTATAFQDDEAGRKNIYKGWYCPENRKKAIQNEIAVGYHFNYNLGYERCTKPAGLERTSETPILFCYWDDKAPLGPTGNPMYMGNYFSVPTDPASDENTYTTWRFTPSVSGVHGNSTNFLLADGHVERIRTLEDQVSYARQFHWDVPVNAYKSLNSKPRW